MHWAKVVSWLEPGGSGGPHGPARLMEKHEQRCDAQDSVVLEERAGDTRKRSKGCTG